MKRHDLLELGRFGLVGALGFVVDTGGFLLGVALGLPALLAKVAATLVAVGVTFAFNRSFTFRGAGQLPFGAALAKYYAGSVAGMIVNWVAFAGLSVVVGLTPAAVLAAIISAVFNFLVYKFIAFRRPQ